MKRTSGYSDMSSEMVMWVGVESLWGSREKWVEPRKAKQVLVLLDAFGELVAELVRGTTYEPEDMADTRYYQYLINTHRGGKRRPGRFKRHFINHFYDSTSLFASIKDEGLKRPLDFLIDPTNHVYLQAGYRRFSIVRGLGHTHVPIVIRRTG